VAAGRGALLPGPARLGKVITAVLAYLLAVRLLAAAAAELGLLVWLAASTAHLVAALAAQD
jgi:hypothetical protein